MGRSEKQQVRLASYDLGVGGTYIFPYDILVL